jgi:choline dehydrogenase-like flavoprotein
MSAAQNNSYDVVIVGAGVSGALIAKQLGLAGKRVLILESGAGLPSNNNDFVQRFYQSLAKVPEIPYSPDLLKPPPGFKLVNPTLMNAPRPTVLTLDPDNWKDPTQSYLIQSGRGADVIFVMGTTGEWNKLDQRRRLRPLIPRLSRRARH